MELRQTVGAAANTKYGKSQRVYPLTGMIFCAGCGWPMRGTTWGQNGFSYKDSSRIELPGLCDQPTIKAIPLEKPVIKLLHHATQVWEKSVSPGSVTKYIEDAEADLQRAQELYIRAEITKDILDREKDRTKKS